MTSIQVTTDDRQESVAKVLNLLRFVTPDEEYLFDCDNYTNNSSELSDPFSDFDGAKLYQEQKKKRLSKLEADILLMSGFSSEFLKVQEEVQNEMMLSPRICSEDLLCIEPSLKIKPENDEFISELKEIIDSCGLDSYTSIHNVPKTKEEIRESRNQLVKSSSFDVVETNSLSGIWRMLEAPESNNNGFPISPIGYNIYKDKRIEWLNRFDLTWDNKEATRKKCENWLKTNE